MAEVSETTSQNTKTDHNTIASTKKSDGDLQTISREITKHSLAFSQVGHTGIAEPGTPNLPFA